MEVIVQKSMTCLIKQAFLHHQDNFSRRQFCFFLYFGSSKSLLYHYLLLLILFFLVSQRLSKTVLSSDDGCRGRGGWGENKRYFSSQLFIAKCGICDDRVSLKLYFYRDFSLLHLFFHYHVFQFFNGFIKGFCLFVITLCFVSK